MAAGPRAQAKAPLQPAAPGQRTYYVTRQRGGSRQLVPLFKGLYEPPIPRHDWTAPPVYL